MSPKLSQSTDDSVKRTPNAVKLVGEVIVPGASHFIDGNIRTGVVHLLGAVAPIALLGGPAGLLASLLVRGNSFTTSALHKPIHRALMGGEYATVAGEEPAGGRGTT
jgi:hypothetical protein